MDSKKKFLFLIIFCVIVIAAMLLYLFIRNRQGQVGTNTKVELVYQGLWEPSSVFEEVISEYEKENPNVTIKYSQERITQYEENLYSWLDDENRTPDIIRIHNTWTYKFEEKLSPLPPEVMGSSEYQQTFYPTAIKDFTGRDGSIYAIPIEIDGLALFYNKDLFTSAGITEPPADWDTFIETAKELTETNSSGEITSAGAAIGCSNNINHSAEILSALMLQNSVQMTNSDGSEATFNTKKGQDTLVYYTDFVNVHKVWSCSLGSDLDLFIQGKLAMMIGPSWRAFDVINNNAQINFGMAVLPQLPGTDFEINYASYWGEAVSAKSPNQLEAWKFIKYLSESAQQKKLYTAVTSDLRAFGEPYSRQDLATEIESDPYAGAIIKMAPTMTSWKLGDQTTTEAALNKAITDLIDKRSSESAALEEAVTTINTKLKELYGL